VAAHSYTAVEGKSPKTPKPLFISIIDDIEVNNDDDQSDFNKFPKDSDL
jgi:hypothetical protein